MKSRLKLALAAIVLLASALPAFSATLYAVIFANTEDEGIGCIYDVVNIGTFLKDVQKETGLALKAKVRLAQSGVDPDRLAAIRTWSTVAEGWSKADLEAEIKAINPGADDVVMFYYSGHGGRMSNKKGKWPDMALKDKLVDLQYPIDLIAKKPVQPRLAFSIGDCCNSYMDRSAEPKTRAAKISSGFGTLFMEATGQVIASSSEPGQYSLGGSDGGVFTNAYIKAAYNPTNGDWEAVLKAAQQLAVKSSDGRQKAQYEFTGAQAATPTVAAPALASAPAASGWGSAQAHAAPAAAASSGWGSAQGQAAAPSVSVSVSSDDEELLDCIPIVKGKASGKRKPGASPYAFTELKSASLDGSGDDLVVVMDLKAMSEELPFNDPEVPDNELEYDWSAYIDADGDEEDDYALSMMHFKFEGAEPEEGSVLDHCQANLWSLRDGGGSAVDMDVEADIRKNSIVLTVYDYRDEFALKKGATVTFSALYYPRGELFHSDWR